MPRDILSEYGKDVPHPQVPSLSGSGQVKSKELAYSPPTTTFNHYREAPGLGGDNCGNCGTQK